MITHQLMMEMTREYMILSISNYISFSLFITYTHRVNGGGGGPKYTLVDDTKYLHSMSEDNKFSSPVICQLTADDQSIMKSSPNSQQPTLSQLTTANLHMEIEDGSVIKNEDSTTNYVMPSYLH